MRSLLRLNYHKNQLGARVLRELVRRCVDTLEVKRDHVNLFGIISLEEPKTRKEEQT